MKIKELSERLNVTQKTIRYYETQGFLKPSLEEKNGRQFREYSQEDVKVMEGIIQLRKLSFTVEEIRMIFEEPETIPMVCREKKEQLVRKYEYDRFLLEVFDKLRPVEAGDVDALQRQMTEAKRIVRQEHTEWQPIFRKLDEEFSDDRYQRWEAQREKQKDASAYMFGVLNSPMCKSVTSGYKMI